MTVEQLLSLSASLKRDLEDIQEEMQVVSEAIIQARIDRIKKRMDQSGAPLPSHADQPPVL